MSGTMDTSPGNVYINVNRVNVLWVWANVLGITTQQCQDQDSSCNLLW